MVKHCQYPLQWTRSDCLEPQLRLSSVGKRELWGWLVMSARSPWGRAGQDNACVPTTLEAKLLCSLRYWGSIWYPYGFLQGDMKTCIKSWPYLQEMVHRGEKWNEKNKYKWQLLCLKTLRILIFLWGRGLQGLLVFSICFKSSQLVSHASYRGQAIKPKL